MVNGFRILFKRDNMDSNYISAPKDFRHMEGKSIDFRKTFDLNCRENDEMLRLYLRKAGMSDDIDALTTDQRREYIYDIIRSHKMPGYWLPSSMKYDPLPPPSVRPPTLSPLAERKTVEESPIINYRRGTMHSSSSSGSLHSLSAGSASVPNRFVPAPATPPSPSSVVTSAKGSKYEISGPTNFTHLAGDMTRDRTRNAFDLSSNSNDNVLKKYMMEHGIGEDDIIGMRKRDLIKKIVHSNFTWLPTKRNAEKQMPNLVYATISTNNQKTPPPSPPPPPIPASHTEQKPTFSNYASLTSKFVDLANEPATDLSSNGRKSVVRPMNMPPPPPPPSIITAPRPKTNINKGSQQNSEPLYAVIGPREKGKKTDAAPIPAPPTTFSKPTVHASQVQVPPPPPPLPVASESGGSAIAQNPTERLKLPPPPPPALTQKPIKQPSPLYAAVPTSSLSSSEKSAKSAMCNSTLAPPPLPSPIPSKSSGFIPPPPPMPNASSGLPPPPPPTQLMPSSAGLKKASSTEVLKNDNDEGDYRDAFLESIRRGITLKKVDRKSATITGVKPSAPRRPPVTDFLTELKMRQGLTLNRIKNPADNPYSVTQSDESHA